MNKKLEFKSHINVIEDENLIINKSKMGMKFIMILLFICLQ